VSASERQKLMSLCLPTLGIKSPHVYKNEEMPTEFYIQKHLLIFQKKVKKHHGGSEENRYDA
jgi:hypothetical protein